MDRGITNIPNVQNIVIPVDLIQTSFNTVLNIGYYNNTSVYTTYLWTFNHITGQNESYVNIASFRATKAVNVSNYLNDTVLLLGYTGASNTISYTFINTNTLSYTPVRTINSTPMTFTYTNYHESLIYFNDSVYYMYHNSVPNIEVYKFTISGSEFNDLTLSYIDKTTFTGTASYSLCKQLSESGNPDKVVFIGVKQTSTVSYINFWYYTILTLGENPSFTNEIYVDQTSVDIQTYRYVSTIINNTVNIDYLMADKSYCFCTATSSNNSSASSSGRNPLLVKFTYNNNTNRLELNTIRLNVSGWESNVTYRIIDDNNWIYVYYVPSTSSSSSTSMFIFAYNKNTAAIIGAHSKITEIGNLPYISGWSAAIYQYCKTSISKNGYLILSYIPSTGSGNNYNCCAVMSHYINNNSISLGFYPNNTSTKALAVTSGNIGDTVRIAYEGTYHVPGVPTGSIYNTDTSYAIAKKSGVLTVSEPQQTSKVYYGSYVGDGIRGLSESNPMSITFPFEPKVLWMIGTQDTTHISLMHLTNVGMITLSALTDTYTRGAGILCTSVGSSSVNQDYTYAKMSSDRKTYTWYYSTNIDMYYILNAPGTTYRYIAIG